MNKTFGAAGAVGTPESTERSCWYWIREVCLAEVLSRQVETPRRAKLMERALPQAV